VLFTAIYISLPKDAQGYFAHPLLSDSKKIATHFNRTPVTKLENVLKKEGQSKKDKFNAVHVRALYFTKNSKQQMHKEFFRHL
jgi:hypothetical protein